LDRDILRRNTLEMALSKEAAYKGVSAHSKNKSNTN
jgi:hypothetical protein